MRSLKLVPALLSASLFTNVLAKGNFDATVVVTTTRTVTYCPVANLFDCAAPAPTEHWGDWTQTASSTTTTTGTTTKSGEGSTTTTTTGSVTSTTTTSGYDGNNGTTTTTTGPVTSTTTSHYGGNNGTTTTTTSGFGGNGTTTTTTTGSSTTTTTTTTSSISTCANATAPHTASPTLAQPTCNSATDRSRWCFGGVNTDTHNTIGNGLGGRGPAKKFTLELAEGSVSFDGSANVTAYTINGKTPGEAIEVNWGDNVEVTVINNLKAPTSIHWHGIRQEGNNDQDGVPGVSECPITPGTTRVYTWVATTYGTGWYHSHLASQYGGGIRGPIIVHGPASANYDLDMGAIMINEKFDNTIEVQAALAAKNPGQLAASQNYLLNGKNKSPDGKTGENAKWIVKSGRKHLFRFINSSAQSGYAVHFDGHKMQVISADFTPVVPYETEWLYIQSGQRYNVIVEMNQTPGAYNLRAVTQVGCGTTSANNGMTATSNGIFEYEEVCAGVAPANVTLTFNANVCADEPIASLIPVVSKGAGDVNQFTASAKLMPAGNAGVQPFPVGGVNTPIVRWFMGPLLDLATTNASAAKGNKTMMVDFDLPTLRSMSTLPDEGYNSSIYSNAVVLDGPANQWVYFAIQNNFQTSHPMHLHGHDFSVLGQGHGVFTSDMVGQLNFGNTIRRDTVLLWGAPVIDPSTGRPFTGPNAPAQSGWTVIGFQTDNPGAWVMHCHIIFHADGGMALQFIEQPDSIKDYYGSQFQDVCSKYESWEAAGGAGKLNYESGLKKRYAAHLDAHKNLHGAHSF